MRMVLRHGTTSPLISARTRMGESVADWARVCGVSSRQYRRYERKESGVPRARQAALYAHVERYVIQRLPANTKGRDFVVGDLHGHHAALESLLREACFDPSQDRVFSVGDLVDRGPESFQTLRLLQEPWFFAVRGNHEDMLLDFALGGDNYGRPTRDHPFLHNGGRWFLEMSPEQDALWNDDLLPRTALLPHILVIGEGAARFQIVHAELDGVAQRLTDIALDAPLADLNQARDREFIEGFDGFGHQRMRFLWGRALIHHKGVLTAPTGLSPTFCGHTPARHILTQGGHIFVDTGAALLGNEKAPEARVTLVEVLVGDAPYAAAGGAPYAIAAEYRGPSSISA